MSQPKPIHNQAEPTFEVLKRLVDRKAEAGRLKYGIALQPLNSRCSLVDLLEELVDGSKYALNEIRNQREILQKLVRWSNDLAVVDDAGAKLVQQGIEELFVALGGWRSISMYDDLLGDFADVGKMVNVPRRYGMTDQVPPAAHDAAVKAAVLDEKASISADRAWIDGARFGWNCGVLEARNDLDAAIDSRRRQIDQADRIAREAAAAKESA